MRKVKDNRQAAWAHDVEEEVKEAPKLRYDQETRRHTQAVRRHRKKRRMHDDYSSDEHELDVDIDAENDLSVAFALVWANMWTKVKDACDLNIYNVN